MHQTTSGSSSLPTTSSNNPKTSVLKSLENILSQWKFGLFPTFLLLFIFSSILIVYLFFANPMGSELIKQLPSITSSDAIRAHENHLFPHTVHQMWKTKDSLSVDFKRWRKGCQQLNSNFSFHLYDDEDLKLFTHQHYPEYSRLFDSLKGVYMADMARVLIAYHFGGLYIDLDFYCYHSFECLENYIVQELLSHISSSNASYVTNKDLFLEQLHSHSLQLLVVSREPALHAYYIHKIPRIVIQDFYFATPKHPFFKWFLDKINDQFQKSLHISQIEMKKGPFSYSIQHILDEYYQSQNHSLFQQSESLVARRTVRNTNRRRRLDSSVAGSASNASASAVSESASEQSSRQKASVEYILEMKAEVVHPLIDSTNSRIAKGCEDKASNEKYGLQWVCHQFSRGRYLYPTLNTMLVHMWTHSFLSLSFLRGWYEHSNYMHVEKTLTPTHHCPVPPVH